MNNDKIDAFLSRANNFWGFHFFLWHKLPAAYWSGVRLKRCDRQKAVTTVPYKRMSQNPFGSTYFACLAMAAELSTGILVLAATQGSRVSMLVVNMEAKFLKKATGITYFECKDGSLAFDAVRQTLETGEGVVMQMRSVGRNEAGEEVAEFVFTWSVKGKS